MKVNISPMIFVFLLYQIAANGLKSSAQFCFSSVTGIVSSAFFMEIVFNFRFTALLQSQSIQNSSLTLLATNVPFSQERNVHCMPYFHLNKT